MVNYGRPGPLGDKVEEVIAGKVAELVARVGGKSVDKRDSGEKK